MQLIPVQDKPFVVPWIDIEDAEYMCPTEVSQSYAGYVNLGKPMTLDKKE